MVSGLRIGSPGYACTETMSRPRRPSISALLAIATLHFQVVCWPDGPRLCCGKCVTAVEKAVKSIAGVTSHTAEKNVETFTVEGDFSTKELAEALNKAGFERNDQVIALSSMG